MFGIQNLGLQLASVRFGDAACCEVAVRCIWQLDVCRLMLGLFMSA